MKDRFHIHFLGLDFAGKTTMVNRWIRRAYMPADKPSVSLETYQIEINNLPLTLYDLPGQKTFQEFLWPSMLNNLKIDSLLFYISVAEEEQNRWSEALEVLREVITGIESRTDSSILIAVLANKIDQISNEQQERIKNRLLENLQKKGIWDQISRFCSVYNLFGTSALTGEGIEEVIDWLTENLREYSVQQALIKEVYIIKENGLSMAHWAKDSIKKREVDQNFFSNFFSAFRSFSSEIHIGPIEVVETFTSKIVFLHREINKAMFYLVLVSDKSALSRDLFIFGGRLQKALNRRDFESIISAPTLFKRIIEKVYSEVFSD
ncbi:MAG: ADP-ribosylation factor-like protein [Promethearchaeota archaeon]